MTNSQIIINPNSEAFGKNNYIKTHYWSDFFCTNCNERATYLLPKGVRKKGLKMDCPNCGCEETL